MAILANVCRISLIATWHCYRNTLNRYQMYIFDWWLRYCIVWVYLGTGRYCRCNCRLSNRLATCIWSDRGCGTIENTRNNNIIESNSRHIVSLSSIGNQIYPDAAEIVCYRISMDAMQSIWTNVSVLIDSIYANCLFCSHEEMKKEAKRLLSISLCNVEFVPQFDDHLVDYFRDRLIDENNVDIWHMVGIR